MAKILVFAEPHGSTVKSVTFEILGKAQGHILEVATIGNLGSSALQDLARYGAQRVHAIKGKNLEKYSPEAYAEALQDFISKGNYDYVFAGATSAGKDFFPRLAGLFNAGMASDVVNFLFEGDKWFGTRPLFAGKCLAKVELQGPKPYFITIRPNAFGLPTSPKSSSPT
ncbi:MAG: hypothetical protein AABY86_11065, partial [Bdellovibrionota bacterium]